MLQLQNITLKDTLNLSINLKTHVKSKHEGVRYQCDESGFAATTKGNLKTHIESKHGFVPYPCSECDFVAITKCALKI